LKKQIPPRRSVADVLVVDDTPANLQLLSSLLGKEGYNVRCAVSSRLALATVAFQAPDLILLDIKMPVMDGFEVYAELKRHPESQDIPVIFLSALDDPRERAHALEMGAVDYVTKPFDAADLLAKVNKQLNP
jgi:CheY-like chemotaxis protein